MSGFGRGGGLPLGSEEGAEWLRAGPVSFRSGVQGDRGKVPLGLQENAKGGEAWTQLATLKQVSTLLQRILLRAKRKPCPENQSPGSESWSVRTPRQFTSPPKTVRKSQENRQIKDPRKKHFPAILNSSVKIITFNIENLGRNT